MKWLVMALLLFVLQIATVILIEYRRPSKAIAWLVILFVLPLVGFLFYYFVAKEYSHRRFARHEGSTDLDLLKEQLTHRCGQRLRETSFEQINGEENPLHDMLKTIPNAPITACNETTVFAEGAEAFEAMLKAMAEAKNHIHIEFYIVRDDDLGSRLQHLMIEKAKQGVKVRLLYDGIGSHRLGKDYLKRLRDAGVETGCFLPPLRSFFDQRINYRNHRKIVVVDGKVGFFGGLNVGDEYIGNDSKIGYWRDTHFRIMGDAVCWLQYTFVADWHFVKGRLLTEDEFFPMQANHGEEWVQVLKCGPDEPRNRIPELLFTCMVSAKKRIYVESPYLIPDPGMLMALKTAAIHGVDVRIIIPTVPDTMIVYCATLSYAQELLNAGVRIYRYKKGFIHAKVFVADHLAFSGSTNMDMRSFYGQFEINAVFFDGKVVNRLVEDFYTDLKESKEMSLSDFEKRPTMQKLKEAFARLLSPLF
ncbi:cardiolipin synthase [uncultured Paenibacillus sp.]|uniref:cardiolipin synthase n=1 Tax=uncultured Paenibacillus sp. TaxID=227322 RepID=UPI0028D882DB|nr:cardiolipin synthase [uncultured Paenibacillus sp.]